MADDVIRTLRVTNNAKGQRHEITLKLGLQLTEVYFPYLGYVFHYFLCKNQSPIKFSFR